MQPFLFIVGHPKEKQINCKARDIPSAGAQATQPNVALVHEGCRKNGIVALAAVSTRLSTSPPFGRCAIFGHKRGKLKTKTGERLQAMRIPRTFFVLLFLATVGLRGAEDKYDYDHSVDFTPYRTYAWHPETVAPDNYPLIDSAKLDGVIRSAVEKQLGSRGFSKTKDQPDLLVSYTVAGQLKTDLRQVDSGSGIPGLPEGHWRPFFEGNVDAQPRREGTLTINIFDAKENRIIWQSVGTDVVKDAKDIEKKINRGVKKSLQHFPPKSR